VKVIDSRIEPMKRVANFRSVLGIRSNLGICYAFLW
jgi:hypothetical protein